MFQLLDRRTCETAMGKCWIKCCCHAQIKISQVFNKMCSQCLFPDVYKSGTSCYQLVTKLMRSTDLQQVVPTSLISSARNKLLTR